MDSMNATETIAAAIEKLEAQRDDSGAWDWRVNPHRHGEYGHSIGSWENLHGYYDNPDAVVNTKTVARDMLPEDADLIVTLHRTIDAQLAILRSGLAHDGYSDQVIDLHAEALARAILGD